MIFSVTGNRQRRWDIVCLQERLIPNIAVLQEEPTLSFSRIQSQKSKSGEL
jgi:hypothetical protein